MKSKKQLTFYLIGSLRNKYLPELEKKIKAKTKINTFLEWYGAGQKADDCFKEYHTGRGLSYREALKTPAARHIFSFDKEHLDRCDGAILVMPAGKSCHLEAGYMVGQGKPVYMVFPDGEPEGRYDLMYQFLTDIFYSDNELLTTLKKLS